MNIRPQHLVILCLNFLAMAIVSPISSHAEEVLSEAELISREKKAEAIMTETTRLSRDFGLYARARDQYYFSAKGLQILTKDWQNHWHTWLANWFRLLAVIEITDEQSFRNVVKTSSDLLEEQAEIQAKIQRSVFLIKTLEGSHLGIIKQFDSRPYPALTNIKDLIGTLKHSQEKYRDTTSSLSKIIEKRQSKMAALKDGIIDAVNAKIRTQLLKSGLSMIDEKIRESEEAFIYSQTILPLLVALQDTIHRLTGKVTEFAYHQAEDLHQQALAQCREVESKIDGLIKDNSLKPVFAAKISKNINTQCEEANSIFADLVNVGLSIPELITEYGNLQKTLVKDHCQDAKASRTINCDQFAVLAAINPEKIKSMNPELLRYYEYQWAGLAGQGVEQ